MTRRIFAFLALFGVGLLVLLMFDREGAPQIDTQRAPGRDFTGMSRLRPSGPFFHARLEPREGGERVRRYDISSRDSSATDDGGVALHDVEMDFYDEDGRQRISRLVASTARGHVELGGGDLEPRLGSRVHLEVARLIVDSGGRMMPLALRALRLDADLDRQVFTTRTGAGEDDVAHIEGVGLAAQGRGLTVELTRGHLQFDSDASLRITTDEGIVASLVSAGPLEIDREPDDVDGRPRSIRIRAHNRPRLVIEDGRGTVLEAERSIEVVGESSGEDEEVVKFDRLVALQAVVLHSEGRVFQSERATFRMDALGRPEAATFEGNPRAILPIERSAGTPVGTAELWGAGPMTMSWPKVEGDVARADAQRRFQIAGPAELRFEGAHLWAAGGIHGRVTGDDDRVQFRAFGDVELTRDGWQLSTPELEGHAEGRELEAHARGPGRIAGTRLDGTRMSLLARDGFTFRVVDDRWSMPVARGVDLEWLGERPLLARADRVEDLEADFEQDRLAFVAEGAVEVQSLDHFMRGHRMVVRSMSEGELVGGPDGNPATYLSPFGEIEAGSITRSASRIEADGDVRARIDAPNGLEGTIRADRLLVSGAPEDWTEPPTEPFLLLAEGNVQSRLARGADRHDVDAGRIEIARDPGITRRAIPATTRIAAEDGVDARITIDGQETRIRARELVGRAADGGLDADRRLVDPTGTFVAQGEVLLDRGGDAPLRAEGERLVLRHDLTGRLEAAPGRRVRAAGILPGGDRPFDLDATALEFEGEERLVAYHPRIEVETPEGVPELGDVLGPRSYGTGELLVATRERVVLSGDALIHGTTQEGAPWSLESDRTTLVTALPGSRLPYESVTAEGDVRIRFADGRFAQGARLVAEAWSRRLRIEGEPGGVARLVDARSVWEVTFFEIDTQHRLPRTGSGTVRPRGPLDVDPWSERR